MSFNPTSLTAPFAPSAISWRAQSVSNKNPEAPKAMALAYIDARDVMNRLDDVCGIDGWEDSYTETPLGRVICTIRIRCGEGWVSKSDGAGKTDVEGDKGGISDAFKRAAVKWGIGRYLYDMPTPWVACELYNGKWSKWTPAGLAELQRIASKNSPTVPQGMLETTQLMIDAINACETQIALKGWLRDNKKAALDSPDHLLITDTYNARKLEVEKMDTVAA
jgi:hypothetical protein